MTIPTEAATLLRDLRNLIDFAAQENVHHPDYDLAAAFEAALTKAEAVAVAWIRYRPDGLWDGPIHSSEFTEFHRKSGQWMPLYAHAPPAE